MLGHHHTLEPRNIRFYYNPVTSKLQPIGYDQHDPIGPWENLIGETKKINANHTGQKMVLWEESFFTDTTFFKAYIRILNEISNMEENIDFYYPKNL